LHPSCGRAEGDCFHGTTVAGPTASDHARGGLRPRPSARRRRAADGLAARAAGDDHTATARFARAAQLAAESGHVDTLRLLAGVVDIVDASAGTVRLRPDVDTAQAMALDTRSTRTTRSTVE